MKSKLSIDKKFIVVKSLIEDRKKWSLRHKYDKSLEYSELFRNINSMEVKLKTRIYYSRDQFYNPF